MHFFAAPFVIFVALGILGEPSAKDTLFLQEHFVYAPQTAKREASGPGSRNYRVLAIVTRSTPTPP